MSFEDFEGALAVVMLCSVGKDYLILRAASRSITGYDDARRLMKTWAARTNKPDKTAARLLREAGTVTPETRRVIARQIRRFLRSKEHDQEDPAMSNSYSSMGTVIRALKTVLLGNCEKNVQGAQTMDSSTTSTATTSHSSVEFPTDSSSSPRDSAKTVTVAPATAAATAVDRSVRQAEDRSTPLVDKQLLQEMEKRTNTLADLLQEKRHNSALKKENGHCRMKLKEVKGGYFGRWGRRGLRGRVRSAGLRGYGFVHDNTLQYPIYTEYMKTVECNVMTDVVITKTSCMLSPVFCVFSN